MKHFNYLLLHNNRLYQLYSLLFFLSLISFACTSEQNDIKIVWKEDKATSIKISTNLFRNFPPDSILLFLSVRLLNGSDTTSMLGGLQNLDDLSFTPVIPFTRGLQYAVYYKFQKLAVFKIPDAFASDAPRVVAFYPNADTLPENLLKVYLQFSHPMREGQTEKYIRLIKNGKDTLNDVFLFLQPELWNEDRTVLTIWLNPGRIKRNLQPNLQLGTPLTENVHYQLFVSKEWSDNQGRFLENDLLHSFIVGKRDSISPLVENWQLQLPKSSSKSALHINLVEPLDHFLLMECLRITTREGKPVNGVFTTTEHDKQLHFIPTTPWKEMEYTLDVESRLEDLAGNNLNRVFDRDNTQPKKGITNNSTRISFLIK